jgi:hypothetical protein
MGYEYHKRPGDYRTKAATDLKFDVGLSTGSLTVPTLTSTTLITAPAITSTASVTTVQYKRTGITQSTAASTALTARGVVELGTSSTTAAGNWILSVPTAGEEMTLVVKLNGSTFGVSVNASTATAVTFGAVAATTGQIRMVMPGILGTAATLVALSSAQWLVTSHNGCSFSTAAA